MSNYIYHGSQGLITLPERNVQTFPSGLVRIDRVYACRKTLADRFRRDLAVGNPLPFDDGAPTIDGAAIFPDPQEVVRDDGFAEFRVSAYGRTNTIGTRRQNIVRAETNTDNVERILPFERPNPPILTYNFTEVIQETAFLSNTLIEDFVDPTDLAAQIRLLPPEDRRVIRVTQLAKNASITTDRFLIPKIDPPIIAVDGGVIVQYYRTVDEIGQDLTSPTTAFNARAALYLFNLSKFKLQNLETRSFGRFSEFIVTYSPSPAAVTAIAVAQSNKFFINGAQLNL